MPAGYPGRLDGSGTTGYLSMGAVQRLCVSAGYPGTFNGSTLISYTNMGAAQKAAPITATMAATYTPGYTFAGTSTFVAPVVPGGRGGGDKGKGAKKAKGHPHRRFVSESIGILRIVLRNQTFIGRSVTPEPEVVAPEPVETSAPIEVLPPLPAKTVETLADEILSQVLNEPEPADPNALSAFIQSIPVELPPEPPLFPNNVLMSIPPSAIPDQRALKLKKRRREEETLLMAIIQHMEDL